MLLTAVKRLTLGLALIAMASCVLLAADWGQRSRRGGQVPRVAIVQYASQPVIDLGVQGMLDGLAEAGFIDGKSVRLRRYNAENDVATANAIAREVTNGQYDLILTATTPCLQAVANANRTGRTPHIFGLVSDPFIAGVGIRRDNPLDHPQYLAGIGTMQPVAESLKLAKRLYPGLKTVGVPWNPAETNSEVCVKQARPAAKQLGLQLLEATVENSAGVREAVSSLVSRGADAIWVGGDITVNVALDAALEVARQARIPVLTCIPGDVERGTLVDLGADYHEVGRLTGELGSQVLRGTSPASIPVRDVLPPQLGLNRLALQGLKDPWQIPPDLLRDADVVIDDKGTHRKERQVRIPAPPAGRTFQIGIAYFAPEPGADNCMRGLFDGLRELGFVEGRNLVVKKAHAQGEIANIPAVLQNFDNQDLDLIIPMTTPCVTAACRVVKKTPVVFTYCYDPIAAGVGKSFTDHLPNVTGVGSFPPVPETVAVIEQLVPGVRAVGTWYNSSEANSTKVVSVAREHFKKAGIQLEEVTITSSSEVLQAAQVLSRRGIQAFWITGDNTAIQAFDAIVKVAQAAQLPLINDPEVAAQGALACVGVGFYQSGVATAKPAARVLLGAGPPSSPLENVAVRQVVLNDAVALELGITFPPALVKEAHASR